MRQEKTHNTLIKTEADSENRRRKEVMEMKKENALQHEKGGLSRYDRAKLAQEIVGLFAFIALPIFCLVLASTTDIIHNSVSKLGWRCNRMDCFIAYFVLLIPLFFAETVIHVKLSGRLGLGLLCCIFGSLMMLITYCIPYAFDSPSTALVLHNTFGALSAVGFLGTMFCSVVHILPYDFSSVKRGLLIYAAALFIDIVVIIAVGTITGIVQLMLAMELTWGMFAVNEKLRRERL